MSAASAVITPQPIELTVDLVAALQTKWLIPNHQKTPATPHGLILVDLQASSETTDDHQDETEKFKAAGPASSSPGPWLSEGLADCGMKERTGNLSKAGKARYKRLRVAQWVQGTVSKKLGIVHKYIAAKKAAK